MTMQGGTPNYLPCHSTAGTVTVNKIVDFDYPIQKHLGLKQVCVCVVCRVRIRHSTREQRCPVVARIAR